MQLVLQAPDTAMASSSARRRSALSAYGSSRRCLSRSLSLAFSSSPSRARARSRDTPVHVSSYFCRCRHMCLETSIYNISCRAAVSVARVAESVAESVAVSADTSIRRSWSCRTAASVVSVAVSADAMAYGAAGAAGLQHVLHAAEVGQCRARLC
jgi:hypothetical protein